MSKWSDILNNQAEKIKQVYMKLLFFLLNFLSHYVSLLQIKFAQIPPYF